MLGNMTKWGNWLIRLATGVLASIFLVYGILMLWDMYRTEINAFASYDLLKYRPNVEEEEPPYLDDLIKINPDTRAWLTIYNTHIDYPVMQGKDDMEYLNKDVYGKFSITGSIYLSYKNSPDFSDKYNLIYGHHIANGSMFGDIDKFTNKDFFNKNKDGVLIMTDKVYNLEVFAVLKTDAYDSNIYYEWKGDLSKALYKRDVNAEKVIALSTCDDATTDARTVLLCNAVIRTDPLPMREKGEGVQREAVGHPMAGAYWAFLNLIILCVMGYAAIKNLFFKGNNVVKIIGVMLFILSGVLFFMVEDMHKPIQVVDMWTLVFLIPPAVFWILLKWRDEAR